MKQQKGSTKPVTCVVAMTVLNFVKDSNAFIPRVLKITSHSTLSSFIKSPKKFSLNTPTQLLLSMDSISASLRPFGNWYCKEDDPIGRSVFYE